MMKVWRDEEGAAIWENSDRFPPFPAGLHNLRFLLEGEFDRLDRNQSGLLLDLALAQRWSLSREPSKVAMDELQAHLILPKQVLVGHHFPLSGVVRLGDHWEIG